MPPMSDFLSEHRPYLDHNALSVWRARGHEVGFHGKSHRWSRALSAEEIDSQIAAPARALKEELDLTTSLRLSLRRSAGAGRGARTRRVRRVHLSPWHGSTRAAGRTAPFDRPRRSRLRPGEALLWTTPHPRAAASGSPPTDDRRGPKGPGRCSLYRSFADFTSTGPRLSERRPASILARSPTMTQMRLSGCTASAAAAPISAALRLWS